VNVTLVDVVETLIIEGAGVGIAFVVIVPELVVALSK
jgi:hypothetical protein